MAITFGLHVIASRYPNFCYVDFDSQGTWGIGETDGIYPQGTWIPCYGPATTLQLLSQEAELIGDWSSAATESENSQEEAGNLAGSFPPPALCELNL